MKAALAEMFSSKKWIGVIAIILLAAIQGVLRHLGEPLDQTTYLSIQVALGLGVGGQAVADHGKTAAQISADAGKGPFTYGGGGS